MNKEQTNNNNISIDDTLKSIDKMGEDIEEAITLIKKQIENEKEQTNNRNISTDDTLKSIKIIENMIENNITIIEEAINNRKKLYSPFDDLNKIKEREIKTLYAVRVIIY